MAAREFDVVVVGAGIVGLSHAWAASKRGLRVAVIDREPVARGASVRNFGMIWPVGQPAGESYDTALRARELWLELASLGVVGVEECGSIHLAHNPDELAVQEEFVAQGTHPVRMLTPAEVLERSSLVEPRGLLGGMESPTECRVDPRGACAWIQAYLWGACGVEVTAGTAVAVEGRTVRASDGRAWAADRILICTGSDLRTLCPEVLADSGLNLCKLQMLRSVAQPRTGVPPHLASGLTLRHYTSFHHCPSLPGLRQRVRDETPELDQYGVHVMTSQFADGEVVLGDSHEYGMVSPFDKAEIDDLILRECRKVFRLDDWSVKERWHGVYAKHPSLPVFEAEPEPGVNVFVGTGGAGMTMALGLADRAWDRWEGEGAAS